MRYRILGNTGLRVSALSFGASSLGGVFGAIDEGQASEAVHRSLDLGVNFIDVSPYYGLTLAETVLGRALRGIDRDRYILATKVGRYGPDFPDFDFSPGRVTRSVDESLARLGVEHIDLIQCHDVEFGDLDAIVGDTIPALRQLQRQGKVRFVGVTGLPLASLRYIAQRVEIDTVLSYCHYQLNDTALADDLPFYQQRGIGVISASPLGMGLLSARGTPHWHPAPPQVKALCLQAAEHCKAKGASIERLAVQFAVDHPGIATTVVGSASPVQMQQNIAAMDEPIDRALLAQVLDILKPVHNVTWRSGHPQNDQGLRL